MYDSVEFEHCKVVDPRLDKNGKAHPNPEVECVHCTHRFFGGVYRIRGHILSISSRGGGTCRDAPQDAIEFFKAMESEKEEAATRKKKRKEMNLISSASTAASTSASASASASAAASGKGQMSIVQALGNGRKAIADAAVARFFYAEGLPFIKGESPYFAEMLQAVAAFGPGYRPPAIKRLRNDMLDAEVDNINKLLEPYFSAMALAGCTLAGDGWQDAHKRPLLNICHVTHKGSIFLKAVDTSGYTKDAEYIADVFCDAIEKVGVENVVQVITDSAANCKAAGELIMERYPTVTYTPCTAHCIDLLLEDIGRMDWVKILIEIGRKIVKFITNHQASLAIFRTHSQKELLCPGDTRFGTNFIMLGRLVEVRKELQKMVVDDKWDEWVARNRSRVGDGALYCKVNVMDDEFFERGEQILKLVAPAIELLRMADADVPSVGKIYAACQQLHEFAKNFEGLSAGRRTAVKNAVRSRWDMLNSDIHCAGYLLDPEFQSHNATSIKEVMTGFYNMAERVYPEDPQKQAKVVEQLHEFRSMQGLFGRPAALEAARNMPAHAWWNMFGACVPDLQRLAIKILAQPSSACSCERNWSTYDYIHNKKRNRLEADRAEKLVFVFSNLRFLKRIQTVGYEEQCWSWEEE